MTDGKAWIESVSKRFTDKGEAAKGVWDLVVNINHVISDIATMTKDFNAHENYYEAGFAIGDLLAIYSFGTPNR